MGSPVVLRAGIPKSASVHLREDVCLGHPDSPDLGSHVSVAQSLQRPPRSVQRFMHGVVAQPPWHYARHDVLTEVVSGPLRRKCLVDILEH